MKNHFYLVGDEIRKQTEGGPIGLELTSALVRMAMIWRDEKFLKKAAEANVQIAMLDRYVDDANMLAGVPKMGDRFDTETGKLK